MFDPGELGGRLGLDQPAGWWPTPPRLKSFEAAGFGHLQVRTPPGSLLADRAPAEAHARALRANLELTGMRVILHGPDDLLAGTREHDRRLEGAIRYAALAGAEVLVYHGARVADRSARAGERLASEARSLRRLLPVAEELGVRIAIENLAPVYPGERYASHRLETVHELVASLASPQAGICLDLGHAHITSGPDLVDRIRPLLADVILFHLHDNFGADRGVQRAGGFEPVKLDLHLPPGAGNLPWAQVAELLSDHPAPLQLEIHPAQRPEPATLAVLTREVLRPVRSVAAAG
jgi:sugar phosphate isomerase/epimerase